VLGLGWWLAVWLSADPDPPQRYWPQGEILDAIRSVESGGRATGNAGNITSYWAGFKQYDEVKSTGLPQVLGVQAAGAAPLVLGHPVENPETIATAIRIGKPARGEQAMQAAEESNGRIIAVSDEQILDMQKMLAKLEGIWVEPASATGLAGLAQEIESGSLNVAGKRIVAVCTGHGLKDPDIITKDMPKPKIVPPTLDALEEIILS
jgi:threonine synthase